MLGSQDPQAASFEQVACRRSVTVGDMVGGAVQQLVMAEPGGARIELFGVGLDGTLQYLEQFEAGSTAWGE